MSRQWDGMGGELVDRCHKIGTLMHTAKTEVLAFAVFPREHRGKNLAQQPDLGQVASE